MADYVRWTAAFPAWLEAAGEDLAEDVAEDVEARARAFAPRRTGRLAASHRVVELRDRVGALASMGVENRAPYVLYVHEGTEHMRANPWLRRAVESERFG
jgi:HK97 gp10 family phage protein